MYAVLRRNGLWPWSCISRPRIFMGTLEIAGYYRNLKQGFTALGYSVTFLNLYPHPFQYGGEDRPLLVRILAWIEAQFQTKPQGKAFLRLKRWQRWTQWLLFWQMALTHEVFLFGAQTSLLPNGADLPILKRLGKTIIMQSHGSDSRPPYLDNAVMHPSKGLSLLQCAQLTAAKKQQIDWMEQYADWVVDTPHQGGILREKPFILWLKIGLTHQPSDQAAAMQAAYQQQEADLKRLQVGKPFDRQVRILHCPSDPVTKGSALIEAAICRLQEKGYDIEYVTVVGQPNQVVMDALASCDIAIDQLYSDYAMPGFATEAAWFAKPVLICGYGKAIWDTLLQPEETPPSVYCVPEAFEGALEKLVSDPLFRVETGLKTRTFIESRWSSIAVAKRYLQLIKGEIPADWWYDPTQPEQPLYLYGYGRTASEVQQFLVDYLTACGPQALGAPNKPWVLEAVQGFAQARALQASTFKAGTFKEREAYVH